MPPKKKEGSETDKISLLILRRKGGHGDHGHHGGAWKIAYADFVTAMMAFFLLMWLLNSTNKSDKQGIADFFNRPLSVAFDHGNSSSASASIINGGGPDIMSKTSAEVAHGDDSKQQNAVLVPNATTQKSADEQDAATPGMVMPATDPTAQTKPVTETPDDAARLKALKDRLDKMIEMNAKLTQFKNQIRIDITSEGLRIQIVDAQNRPMFETGRAELQPYAKEILDQIGLALNDVPNHVTVAGHTDSAPYAGALSGYSNWELSSERANSARRELGIGGLKELKVLQVRGLADSLPLVKDDLSAPANRRISIVVLNKQTEDAFYRDGGRMDIATPGTVTAGNNAQKPSAASASTASPAQSTASSHTSSPDGGSPNNQAASPEAVVARIKAAIDAADPAPHPGTAKGVQGNAQRTPGSSGIASQAAAQPVTPDSGVRRGAPTPQETAAVSGAVNGAATHGGSGAAPVNVAGATPPVTTASAGASPRATAAGAVALQPAGTAPGAGAGAASPQVQTTSSGAIAAPTQKVSTGAITPPSQKVSSGAIQPPAPANVDHNTSDFGHAQ